LSILLRLSNCYASRKLKKPTLFVATLLIEVYGDIRIRPPGSYMADRWVAGPLPRDLPSKMISFSRKFVIDCTKL